MAYRNPIVHQHGESKNGLGYSFPSFFTCAAYRLQAAEYRQLDNYSLLVALSSANCELPTASCELLAVNSKINAASSQQIAIPQAPGRVACYCKGLWADEQFGEV